MTVSAFLAVARAIQALMQEGATPVCSDTFTNRARVIPKQMDTAIAVMPDRAARMGADGEPVPGVWDTTVRMECYARAVQGVAVEDAVDALMNAAVQRLMADPTLDGLVGDCQVISLAWDFDVDGEQTACVTVALGIEHATDAGSLN
ncbi:hypothetical protein [Paracidovorax wautersii]|uniref:DUF3168 domain-containing protein n=1 Tax=Paracidovorax wautersii TaxID=1177982 RepID=A0A1I2E7Y4_9BURK|nr:hypothetical protein [Paracidovorax wautersii]SFE88736.1 hypothetical protein SAMN04489711_106275 [Paracidovorax wautersii]